MLLTSCLALMPVLCLQPEDQRALLPGPLSLPWYSSDNDDVACDILEPEQVSHHACDSAESSALRASCLSCSLDSLA